MATFTELCAKLGDFLNRAEKTAPELAALTKERDDLKAERDGIMAERDTLKTRAEEAEARQDNYQKAGMALQAELTTAKAEVESTKAALAEAEKKAVKIIAAASITEDTAGKASAQSSQEKELTGIDRTIAAMKAGKK